MTLNARLALTFGSAVILSVGACGGAVSDAPDASAVGGADGAMISVPALIMRLLPRWLAVMGIVLAVIGELSVLSLVVPPALFLIPLTRFPGFVWLIAAGFKLPSQLAKVRTTSVEGEGEGK